EGIRSGNEIPKELFFEFLEEGLLLTGKSGAGEQLAGSIRFLATEAKPQYPNRKQIPINVTSELLNEDGSFISFGAFKLRFDGYDDDDLRTAYRELKRQYQSSLQQQLQGILSGHHPVAIKREMDRVIVELIPGAPEPTSAPSSDSDYEMRRIEARDKTRR